MDSWLKAAAKLGEDIQKQASLLADDAGQKGKRELSFREGPLGFELDGVYVSIVDPDGQAMQLGVQPGDKLVSIAGCVIPQNPKEDSVKRWLDEMIRPGRLTFYSEGPKVGASTTAVVFPKESDTADSGLLSIDESWKEDTSPKIFEETVDAPLPDLPELPELPESLMGEARLRAELYAARDEARSLERELEDCKAECQELRHFAAEKADSSLTEAVSEQRLQRLNEQLTAARKEAEDARKRCRQLQAQLDGMSAQCDELRKESVQNEDLAREAMEGREKVLEEEVERLRAHVHSLKAEQHNSVRSVEVELRDGQDRIEELEKRLAQAAQEKRDLEGLVQEAVSRGMTAENQVDAARKEICKLEACHMGEVSNLQARYDRQVCDLQRRIEELETEKGEETTKIPPKSEDGNEESVEKEGEAEEEAAAATPSPISGIAPGSFDTIEDVQELHARIHVLENQCSTLQKKLNARPIVYQAPSTRRRPASLVRSTGLVGVLREIGEQLLRNFTEQLLARDAFLWVFYGHLCVLYVIAASCYAQTGVTSHTVDVDLHSKQALRGAPPG